MLDKITKTYKREGLKGVLFQCYNKVITEAQSFKDWRWIKKHTPSAEYLVLARQTSKILNYQPLISVILPVYNSHHYFLSECINSVINQCYENWQLCIADDASTDDQIRKMLSDFCSKDSRIKLVYLEKNSHIALATNAALELAEGEFLAFIDHDDCLAPHALYEVVVALQADSNYDLIYTNEDKIDRKGRRSEPCFKPALDLEYFLSFMYIGHLALYRRSLVEEIGALREGTEGAQDYDLALRILERTTAVLHVPQILYHWRKHPESVAQNVDAKPYAYQAMRKVLNEALGRRVDPKKAWLEETDKINVNRPRFYVAESKKIVVLLRNAKKSSDSKSIELMKQSKLISKHKLEFVCDADLQVDFAKCLIAKNWADYFNLALEQYSDFDFIYSFDCVANFNLDALEYLVEQSVRPEIACVGSRILTADGKNSIHATYSLNQNILRHNFYNYSVSKAGYGVRLLVQRSASVISSISALYRIEDLQQIPNCRQKFKSIEALEIHLCLSLSKIGKTVLWTPFADIALRVNFSYFPEIIKLSDIPEDYLLLEKLHKLSLYRDPTYPEGLDTNYLDFRVAV